jgi:nucleotide-binding universal stress UspA family protein
MKKILVGLDHSPRAEGVLARAASIAAATGADLYLLRTVGLPAEIPADAYRSSPADVVEQLKATAVRELERVALTLDPTLVTHILVRIGTPWVAIRDAATEHAVDLVVIGSHGYDAVDHVLGTTAAKVVNHADRSVLVVREPKSPKSK